MLTEYAYILAGGQSLRMGQDKLWLAAGGRTLLERTIDTCSRMFKQVKLVATDESKFRHMGVEVVLDWPYAEGPLGGVIAALQDCGGEACFVTAADLYDLDTSTISLLLDSVAGQQYVGIKEGDQIQPLCGVYHQSALPRLIAEARRGNYRMRDVVCGLRCRRLDVPPGEWRNINSPDDFRRVRNSHG
jgi:molybdopterin-guanine dinucleotide biosynthesis protein A